MAFCVRFTAQFQPRMAEELFAVVNKNRNKPVSMVKKAMVPRRPIRGISTPAAAKKLPGIPHTDMITKSRYCLDRLSASSEASFIWARYVAMNELYSGYARPIKPQHSVIKIVFRAIFRDANKADRGERSMCLSVRRILSGRKPLIFQLRCIHLVYIDPYWT